MERINEPQAIIEEFFAFAVRSNQAYFRDLLVLFVQSKQVTTDKGAIIMEYIEGNVESIGSILEREIEGIVERQGNAMKEDAEALESIPSRQ